MKFLLMFLFFIGSVSDCSSDDHPQMKNELIGKWKWVQSSGGIMGKTKTPESTGKEISIEFTDTKFIKYENGVATSELTYTLTIGKSIVKGENAVIITYENQQKQSVEISENRLILYDECYDCFQNEYIKE